MPPTAEQLAESMRPGWELARRLLTLAYLDDGVALIAEMATDGPGEWAVAAMTLALEVADLLHDAGIDIAQYQAAAVAAFEPPEVPDVRD